MLLSSSGSRAETAVGYRFAGVVVDVQRARLRVDGLEVAAGALQLKLLRVLCEADGALVSRQTLFEQVWPRQIISDEALTKLIGRTREMLGVYGSALVTVRGQGVRLDAQVAPAFDVVAAGPEVAAQGSSPAAPDAAAPSAVASKPTSHTNRYTIAALAALVIIALGAAIRWWPARDAVLSAGYALHASDLHASRSETADLVRAAFKAFDNGEIVHARTMMRSAHESDPATPVPALMLAWWEVNNSPDASREWIVAARARLHPDSSAYLRLMIEYFDARSAGNEVRGPINALLDLRPQAWSLQFARAHDQLGNREFAGALNSLQQIPLDIPDAEQVADVLADRVSLGDQAAASLVTRAIRADAMLDACLQGRFAYSRGALIDAVGAFDRCGEAALVRRNYLHVRTAAMFGALAAVETGAVDALQRVDAAARQCHEQNVQSCETELLGLRAFLEARSGRAEVAAASLNEAWQRNRWEWAKPPLLLIALENGLPAPADPVAVAQDVPRDVVFGGVADLLLAWQELARGDRQAAQRQLDQAREHGIAHTYHAEDAALLEARLGGRARPPCRVDPPYPNIARLSACVTLRALKNP
jgi:DNA-binding winged helix-turn-helix (wHTH) protein